MESVSVIFDVSENSYLIHYWSQMKRTALSFLNNLQSAQDIKPMNNMASQKQSFPAAASLETGIDEIKKELQKMTKQLDESMAQIEQEKITANSHIERVRSLDQKYNHLLTFKSAIDAQIIDLKGIYEVNLEKFKSFSNEFELVKNKITEEKTKLEGVIEQLFKAEKKNTKLKGKIGDIESQKQQLTDELEKITNNRKNLENENNDLDKTCSDLKREAEEKEKQLKENQMEVVELDKKIAQLKETNTRLEMEMKQGQEKLENKRGEWEAMKEQISKLNQNLADLDNEISLSIKNQEKAKETQIHENLELQKLQEELNLQNVKLKAEQEKEKALKDELNRIKALCQSETERGESLKQQLQTISKANEAIVNENNDMRKRIGEKENKLGELTQSLQTTRQQLNEEKMNCKTIQSQIDAETQKQNETLRVKKEQLKDLRRQKEDLERQLEEETRMLKESEVEYHNVHNELKLSAANGGINGVGNSEGMNSYTPQRQTNAMTIPNRVKTAGGTKAKPVVKKQETTQPATNRASLAQALFDDDLFSYH